MSEIRDIKPPGPSWQRKRIDGDTPTPDKPGKQRGGRRPAPRPNDEGEHRNPDGKIDEYA